MGFRLILAMLALTAASAEATAGGRCGYQSDPMVTSEGFGVATCAVRERRFHIHDFASERGRGLARYASPDDPMVWGDQWRTDLMGYSNVRDDRYDRRFHRTPARALRVVRRIVHVDVVFGPPIEDSVRTLRAAGPASIRPGAAPRPLGHACERGGVLVLTWTGYSERAECLTTGGRDRPHTPSKGREDPGSGRA